MYRKFALFAVTLSVFSVVLVGCPKPQEAADAGTGAAIDADKRAADAGGKMAAAGTAAAVTDPAKLMEALKADAGLAGVKIQKNAKEELVMTGKVADQALKAKADELIKAAGGTVKNAIIVGK
ncbi:hypothetical protein [Armatimonas sp.]|uniref:hypothetical protein n=1 Tax=Armatimonas sp. TaxID=1872638 RepID=UPI003752A294